MSRKELSSVLDYILNKADAKEFEVIAKACQRRGRDMKAFESLGGEGPGAMARRMAGELKKGVGATMESVRGTVRGFVKDIIRKNAPEITEEQLAALLEEYAPRPGAAAETRRRRASPLRCPRRPPRHGDVLRRLFARRHAAEPAAGALGVEPALAGRILGGLP